MKKLISSVLILTLLLCSIGVTSCFAVGSETVDQKVDTVATTKDLNDIKDQLQEISKQITAQSETKNASEKIKCTFNKLLKVTMGMAKFAGVGAVLGASLYTFKANYPQLIESLIKQSAKANSIPLSYLKLESLKLLLHFNFIGPKLLTYLNLGWFETFNGDVSSMAKGGALFGLAIELLSLTLPRALANLFATAGLLAINAGTISELYISFQELPKYM